MQGVFVPAGTPTAIISRLNQEIVRVVKREDVKEKLFVAGVEAAGSSPKEFADAINADIARWGKLIRDTGIKAE